MNYYQNVEKMVSLPPIRILISIVGKNFILSQKKFFLWEKGKIIPNQVIIKNEDDPKI